jgi:hypothetical protein
MILILARDDSMHNFSVQLFQQGRHRAERLLWLLLPSGPKSQRSPHSLLVFPRPIVQYSSYCFIISPLHLPSTSPLYISPLHLPSTSPCINPFSLSPCPPLSCQCVCECLTIWNLWPDPPSGRVPFKLYCNTRRHDRWEMQGMKGGYRNYPSDVKARHRVIRHTASGQGSWKNVACRVTVCDTTSK